MKLKNGFTLVEMMAVVILLGLVSLIAIPAVNTTIKNTRKSTFENSAYGVIEAGKLYYQNRELLGLELNDTTFTFPEATGLEVNGDKPESGKMLLTSKGNIKLAISNGKYCARKGYETSKITIDEDITNCTLESIGEESTDIKDCECEECICEECPVIEDIKITELVLSAESVSIIPNGTYQINDSAKPINASNKTLSYKSNDESIAIVNELGIITGIKAGETSITVTTTDGSNISKTVDVIVREQIQNVTLDKTEVEIKVGESINIIPTITPTTAAIKTLKWESSDTSIAIVENGIIGGLGVGTTTITASTQDGTNITKTINVKVLEADPNLNFEIVGGTSEPTNPIENTIWINSDTEIGEYQFCSTEPTKRPDGTSLQNGDVWFKTGSISGISLNLLKQNNIDVQIVSTYQYINSNWVLINSKIYKNNNWENSSTYLYYNGEKTTSFNSYTYDICSPATKQFIDVNTYIDIHVYGNTGSKDCLSGIVYRTVNTVDVTDYHTLGIVYTTVEYINYDYSESAIRIGSSIASTNRINQSAGATLHGTIGEKTIKEIDISSLNGAHYIGIENKVQSGTHSSINTLIHEIYLK